jgi:xanthine dehydrogenase molybdenum-binding subunit
VTVETAPKRPALDLLREDLGVVSIKPGCSPQGVCGSCTVLVGGKPRLTCTLPCRSLRDKDVLTLEGWSDDARERYGQAFARVGATLSGYEVPGLLSQARALLDKHPEGPTDDQIDRALQLHLSRGAGWQAVRDAVHELTAPNSGAADPAEVDLALGDAPFVGDLSRPGMLHAALVWVPGPHFQVDDIDVSAVTDARVLTADALGLDLGPTDAPLVLGGGQTGRHAGEVVAVVVAATRELAIAGRDAVVVQGQDLAPLTDAGRSRVVVASGQAADGMAPGGGQRVEQRWSMASVDPGFLEPEACLAVPGDQGVTVYSCGECAGSERAVLNHLLGRDDVRVELVGTRASPGGKDALTVQPFAAAAALATGRPVRLALTLEEGVKLHRKRHAADVEVVLRANQGALTAVDLDVSGDAGGDGQESEPFVYQALAQARGAYAIEELRGEARAFQTHNPPAGAVDGDGVIQVVVALEATVDGVAAALGVDPLQLRRDSLDPASGLKRVLAGISAVEGPNGVGVCALRTLGDAPARARVTWDGHDATVHLDRATVGQGWRNEVRAMVSNHLGCGVDQVEIRCDSDAPASPSDDPGLTLQAIAAHLDDLDQDVGHVPASTRVFTGQGAAARVLLTPEGGVAQVQVWALAGSVLHRPSAISRMHAAIQQGLGTALTEFQAQSGGHADPRLRMQGLIKARAMPPVELHLVEEGGWPVDSSVAVHAAVAAAAINAVRSFQDAAETSLPAGDCEAAFSVGRRRPRKKR